jgi:hypothetical protein
MHRNMHPSILEFVSPCMGQVYSSNKRGFNLQELTKAKEIEEELRKEGRVSSAVPRVRLRERPVDLTDLHRT